MSAQCPLYPQKRTSEPAHVSPSTHQLWQLGDIRRDPPRLVFAEQLGRRSYRPILPAFAIIVPEGGARARSRSALRRWRHTKMSVPCKFERSLLSHDEYETIRLTHHPAIYDVEPAELEAIQSRLREDARQGANT